MGRRARSSAGLRVGLPDARDDGAGVARVRARDARRRRPRHRLVAGDLARAEEAFAHGRGVARRGLPRLLRLLPRGLRVPGGGDAERRVGPLRLLVCRADRGRGVLRPAAGLRAVRRAELLLGRLSPRCDPGRGAGSTGGPAGLAGAGPQDPGLRLPGTRRVLRGPGRGVRDLPLRPVRGLLPADGRLRHARARRLPARSSARSWAGPTAGFSARTACCST